MPSYPDDVRYTEEHEWVRLERGPEGDTGTVGLTWFAQDQLGDVVHVEQPAAGATIARGDAVAEVESVKAVSDVFAPISGEVVLVNPEITDDTAAVVNQDPYGKGWLFKVRMSDPGEAEFLMTASAYEMFLQTQGH